MCAMNSAGARVCGRKKIEIPQNHPATTTTTKISPHRHGLPPDLQNACIAEIPKKKKPYLPFLRAMAGTSDSLRRRAVPDRNPTKFVTPIDCRQNKMSQGLRLHEAHDLDSSLTKTSAHSTRGLQKHGIQHDRIQGGNRSPVAPAAQDTHTAQTLTGETCRDIWAGRKPPPIQLPPVALIKTVIGADGEA